MSYSYFVCWLPVVHPAQLAAQTTLLTQRSKIYYIFLNERIQLLFTGGSGAPSLSLNGNGVKNAVFGSGSVFFDVTKEALGGTFVEKTDAVVTVSGKEVLRQPLHISQNTFASSDVVVFTQGFTEQDLVAEMTRLNESLGNQQGFSLKPASFKSVADSETGVAVIDIGQQNIEAALKNLTSLSASLQTSAAGKSLTPSPNLLYGISMRARYWSSPRCEILGDIAAFANDDWKLLRAADLKTILNLDAEAFRSSKTTLLSVLDTGVNKGDSFDCPETVYKEGHGTHVYNLAQLIAPKASVVFELVCSLEGFCSTAEIANTFFLVRLENNRLKENDENRLELLLSTKYLPEKPKLNSQNKVRLTLLT